LKYYNSDLTHLFFSRIFLIHHGPWTPEDPVSGEGSGKAGQAEEATRPLGNRPEEGCPSRT